MANAKHVDMHVCVYVGFICWQESDQRQHALQLFMYFVLALFIHVYMYMYIHITLYMCAYTCPHTYYYQ